MLRPHNKHVLSLIGVFSLFVLMMLTFIQSGNNQDLRSQAQTPPAVVVTPTPGIGVAVTRMPTIPGSAGVVTPAAPAPLGLCKDPSMICDFDDDGVCMADDLDERTNIINMLYTACVATPGSGSVAMCLACDQKANRDGTFTADDISFCKTYCASVTPKPTGGVTPVVLPTTSVTTPPSCATQKTGDCDCNGKTELGDAECFRRQYMKEAACGSADCNSDNRCSLVDFECIRRNLVF